MLLLSAKKGLAEPYYETYSALFHDLLASACVWAKKKSSIAKLECSNIMNWAPEIQQTASKS